MDLKEKLNKTKLVRTNSIIDTLQLLQEQIDGQKNITENQLNKIIGELINYRSVCIASEALEVEDDKEGQTKLLMSLI